MKKVGKIIGIIFLCGFSLVLGYFVTKYLDKNLYLDTNILVTFEDTKEFNLESNSVLKKEDAIKEYPNKFKVENKSLKKVKYDIILKEIDSNVDKENLEYVLYEGDKEVASGSIKDIKDILYSSNLGMKKSIEYKLYIYLTKEKEEASYKYSLEIASK